MTVATLAHTCDRAEAFARQSLALSRHLRDRQGRARALGQLGWLAHWAGDRELARALLGEALGLARSTGDARTVARTLLFLGDLHWRQGECAEARAVLGEALPIYQEMGDAWSMAGAHTGLGEVARLEGDPRRAAAHFQLSLALYSELNSRPEIPYAVDGLAVLAAEGGQLDRAARLWGAASAIRDSIGASLPPSWQADRAPHPEQVRTTLGDRAFTHTWSEGRSLTLDDVRSLVEFPSPEGTGGPVTDEAVTIQPPPHARPQLHGLTPREEEVLRLVARGVTDAQVAEALVISPRTVGKHLQSIYSELYLPSRSAATRWAIEHDLA